MKTKIILLSIIAILGLVAVFAFKQNTTSATKKYIFITIYETTSTSKWDSKLYIYEGDTKKEIKLEKHDGDFPLGINDVKVHGVINEFLADGYEIVSKTHSYSSVALSKSEYILAK